MGWADVIVKWNVVLITTELLCYKHRGYKYFTLHFTLHYTLHYTIHYTLHNTLHYTLHYYIWTTIEYFTHLLSSV